MAGSKLVAASLLVGALLGVTSMAYAAAIDLAPPGLTAFSSTAVGDSRSFVFRDDSSFSLSSVGVRMDPLVDTFNLTAELFAYDQTTLTRGALLTTNTQGFSDNGLQFYDVSIADALTPGSFYELNLKPFGLGGFDMEFYNFQGPNGGGSSVPYAAGPLTVFDGCGDGNVGGCNNFVIAHFEVNGEGQASVPEPISLALVGAALAGMGLARRRKQI